MLSEIIEGRILGVFIRNLRFVKRKENEVKKEKSCISFVDRDNPENSRVDDWFERICTKCTYLEVGWVGLGGRGWSEKHFLNEYDCQKP